MRCLGLFFPDSKSPNTRRRWADVRDKVSIYPPSTGAEERVGKEADVQWEDHEGGGSVRPTQHVTSYDFYPSWVLRQNRFGIQTVTPLVSSLTNSLDYRQCVGQPSSRSRFRHIKPESESWSKPFSPEGPQTLLCPTGDTKSGPVRPGRVRVRSCSRTPATGRRVGSETGYC